MYIRSLTNILHKLNYWTRMPCLTSIHHPQSARYGQKIKTAAEENVKGP